MKKQQLDTVLNIDNAENKRKKNPQMTAVWRNKNTLVEQMFGLSLSGESVWVVTLFTV